MYKQHHYHDYHHYHHIDRHHRIHYHHQYMIHYHHHHHLIHHISGEAPLSANPPEVWLDLSDLLQEKNQLTTLTSPYTKQVETENDTAIIVSSNNNKNGGCLLYTSDAADE